MSTCDYVSRTRIPGLSFSGGLKDNIQRETGMDRGDLASPLLNCLLTIYPSQDRARTLVQWVKLPAWKVGSFTHCGLEPNSGIQVLRHKMFIPCSLVKVNIVGNLRDLEIACSVSDRQGSNFEFCV